MSFAIWQERPPFAFDKTDREQIYQVGNVWVVTDDPAKATQAEVDAVLNPPPTPPKTLDEKLAAVGLTKADIKAAVANGAVITP